MSNTKRPAAVGVFARGRNRELREQFRCSTTRLLAIVHSGGTGLSPENKEIYEYIWERRHDLLRTSFLPLFEAADLCRRPDTDNPNT